MYPLLDFGSEATDTVSAAAQTGEREVSPGLAMRTWLTTEYRSRSLPVYFSTILSSGASAMTLDNSTFSNNSVQQVANIAIINQRLTKQELPITMFASNAMTTSEVVLSRQ